jgi:hypothetical protein
MLPLLSRGIILRVRQDKEDGSGVRDAGLQVDPDQQTKTSTVLKHLAKAAAGGG